MHLNHTHVPHRITYILSPNSVQLFLHWYGHFPIFVCAQCYFATGWPNIKFIVRVYKHVHTGKIYLESNKKKKSLTIYNSDPAKLNANTQIKKK